MIDPVIRQRYGYGAARLCVHALPYRPGELPPLRDVIAVAREGLGAGSLARGGVALGLAALLAQSLWNALDRPDDLTELQVVPFAEPAPEELPELAALEEPQLPPPPSPEPAPQLTPLPAPVQVAVQQPPREPLPPPERKKPPQPARTRPRVELSALPHSAPTPEPVPRRARAERARDERPERRPSLAMAPAEAPQPEPFRTARVERRSAASTTPAQPRPSIAVAAVPSAPAAPRKSRAPAPRPQAPVRRASARRPSLQAPRAPGAPTGAGGSSRPVRATRRAPARTSRTASNVRAPTVPTSSPVPVSPRPLSGSARLGERPPEQTPDAPRRSEPERSLEGVALGSLASCVSDRDEDALKQRLLSVVGGRAECVSAAGRYRFVETRNLNAFLMWIERAPHRGEADRCVELALALECLKGSPRIAGDTP